MTGAALEVLVWTKLNDATGVYYPDALGALNEAQRLFALLTLSLEKTAVYPLAAATLSYNLLGGLADFLLPRRIYNSQGRQLRPATIAELQALDANWRSSPGIPTRYTLRGFDWLAVYPQPPSADTLTIVYAQCPALLTAAAGSPMRAASQYALANYAAYALRAPEGGQEQAKFKGCFEEFLAEAKRTADLVRMRNRDGGFETAGPFELERVK